MRLVIISDTHSNDLTSLNIPDGDVLIHSGDLSMTGSVPELNRIGRELGELPHPVKIITPGNHDFLFEHSPGLARDLFGPSVEVLIDQSFELEGIKFYGSPYQPEFFEWAFNLPRIGYELEAVWAAIPDDTNVLITHGPPKGILDLLPNGNQVGCERLAERLPGLPDLKLHCFGHIHYAYGYTYNRNRLFVNSSLCDGRNWIANRPIVVDIDPLTKETTVIQYE